MENITEVDLKKLDFDNVDEFCIAYGQFRKDTKLRDIMNKMFSANIKHVYSDMSSDAKTSTHINLGFSEIYFINSKGKLHHMTNSEWGGIWKL